MRCEKQQQPHENVFGNSLKYGNIQVSYIQMLLQKMTIVPSVQSIIIEKHIITSIMKSYTEFLKVRRIPRKVSDLQYFAVFT